MKSTKSTPTAMTKVVYIFAPLIDDIKDLGSKCSMYNTFQGTRIQFVLHCVLIQVDFTHIFQDYFTGTRSIMC